METPAAPAPTGPATGSAPRTGAATLRAGLAALVCGALLVSGCSGDSGSTEAFCDKVDEVPSLEAVLSRFSEVDAEVLADKVEKAREAYHELEDAAPGEIDGETAAVVSLVDDIFDAVIEHPDDPEQAAAQLRAAMDEHEGVDDDRAAVTAFAADECGVTLDADLAD